MQIGHECFIGPANDKNFKYDKLGKATNCDFEGGKGGGHWANSVYKLTH
jgi:hypothetical protein